MSLPGLFEYYCGVVCSWGSGGSVCEKNENMCSLLPGTYGWDPKVLPSMRPSKILLSANLFSIAAFQAPTKPEWGETLQSNGRGCGEAVVGGELCHNSLALTEVFWYPTPYAFVGYCLDHRNCFEIPGIKLLVGKK